MFRAGDEFLNTQFGNNNPYNQDNETGWLDWSQLRTNEDIFRFFKNMIAFSETSSFIEPQPFLAGGCQLVRNWREELILSYDSHSLAFCLHGASQNDDDIYVMINAYWEKLEFQVQEGTAQEWMQNRGHCLGQALTISRTAASLCKR